MEHHQTTTKHTLQTWHQSGQHHQKIQKHWFKFTKILQNYASAVPVLFASLAIHPPQKNRTSSREDSWRVKSLAYKEDQQGQGQK